MSLCLLSDNKYLCVGVASSVDKVICVSSDALINNKELFYDMLEESKVRIVLISISNDALLMKAIELTCKQKNILVFVECPSCVHIPEVNVCGVIMLHRTLTFSKLYEIALAKDLKRYCFPMIGFSKKQEVICLTLLSILQCGTGSGGLIPNVHISAKKISRQKMKLSRDMYINGVNFILLLKLLKLFYGIFKIKCNVKTPVSQ
ncbi:hypothetical protein [Dryocola clanedunensis]|uniref:hypothetical protein n=1 Tax=Cedecea sulfonylureivorans TaxID=3051154 RepID=UPI0019279E64|nr:hypothetical protein [Cedecea sulfonylureivorans]